MNKRIKLAFSLVGATMLVCLFITVVAIFLHKNNVPATGSLPSETYAELTKSAELTSENNIPTSDPLYSDIDYLFREYISDNSITEGDISLEGYDVNPGTGDIRIYGTRDGMNWESIHMNEGKE